MITFRNRGAARPPAHRRPLKMATDAITFLKAMGLDHGTVNVTRIRLNSRGIAVEWRETLRSTTYAVEVRYCKWPVLQVVDLEEFRSWLAALDDFRNWLIRQAAIEL